MIQYPPSVHQIGTLGALPCALAMHGDGKSPLTKSLSNDDNTIVAFCFRPNLVEEDLQGPLARFLYLGDEVVAKKVPLGILVAIANEFMVFGQGPDDGSCKAVTEDRSMPDEHLVGEICVRYHYK